MFYNMDCVEGARKHLADTSVDLIITDPPYGIEGDTLHKHYNRNEEFVLDGYHEIPQKEYSQFSENWIREAARVLKPGGAIYIVSGYTNLVHILNALAKTDLKEINHIIWKYNFGVYTKRKYISSHYHILYYCKPGATSTFNTFCRFSDSEKNDSEGGSLNYQDREDVWVINREYKPGQVKNKNELPTQLLVKMIQYSSSPGDMVCDFFLGSFSTAKVAIGLDRKACGFEISKVAYDFQLEQMKNIIPGGLLGTLRMPPENKNINSGKPLENDEVQNILSLYAACKRSGTKKKDAIELIMGKTGRGFWSISKIINACVAEEKERYEVLPLFEK